MSGWKITQGRFYIRFRMISKICHIIHWKAVWFESNLCEELCELLNYWQCNFFSCTILLLWKSFIFSQQYDHNIAILFNFFFLSHWIMYSTFSVLEYHENITFQGNENITASLHQTPTAFLIKHEPRKGRICAVWQPGLSIRYSPQTALSFTYFLLN